jgi:hypothetical protein
MSFESHKRVLEGLVFSQFFAAVCAEFVGGRILGSTTLTVNGSSFRFLSSLCWSTWFSSSQRSES